MPPFNDWIYLPETSLQHVSVLWITSSLSHNIITIKLENYDQANLSIYFSF